MLMLKQGHVFFEYPDSFMKTFGATLNERDCQFIKPWATFNAHDLFNKCHITPYATSTTISSGENFCI